VDLRCLSLFWLLKLSLLIVVSQFTGTVKDGEWSVDVTMDPHLDPDIMTTRFPLDYLWCQEYYFRNLLLLLLLIGIILIPPVV